MKRRGERAVKLRIKWRSRRTLDVALTFEQWRSEALDDRPFLHYRFGSRALSIRPVFTVLNVSGA